MITETRFGMGKIQEAQDVLKTLGLPPKQQNELSALTLLVLAQLSEETPWSASCRKSLRIHDMLIEMRERFDKEYAENTRETVRRQVIHQFEQAHIVIRNPDNLTLPTNSPRTHYALSKAAIETIRKYGSDEWVEAAQDFLENQRALIERYAREKEQHRIPLVMEGGEAYTLSPGAHNQLQAQIINDFGPLFAPGARVLYVGDTENKMLHVEWEMLQRIGLPVTKHDKLPDVMLYDEKKNWVYLIEAVTSHGPVSPKRFAEIEGALEGCTAKRVYVSAFPDFSVFKNHLSEIAWDTEVWLADTPDHLIHFNGDKFLSVH